MSKRIKIYINFGVCFIVCMTLYLFSTFTFFKNIVQEFLQAQSICWEVEFLVVVLTSLINGAILEYFNKVVFEQPEKIFGMLKYLILQLYLFSIIIFYIMIVADGLFQSNNVLTKNIVCLNLFIFSIYLFYIWYGKKRQQQKLKQADIIKMLICASLIFQSSVIEIIFLGVYLLLLYFITKMNYLDNPKIKVLLQGGTIIIMLIEIYVWTSQMNMLSKIFFNITNVFILYIGKSDWNFLREEKGIG